MALEPSVGNLVVSFKMAVSQVALGNFSFVLVVSVSEQVFFGLVEEPYLVHVLVKHGF